MRIRSPIRLSALIGATVLTTGVAFATPSAGHGDSHWVASWATAVQSIPDLRNPPQLYRPPDVSGRTVREIVYPTLSGHRIRVRFSNVFGRTPLVVAGATIAKSTGGAGIEASTATRLTFAGRGGVVLQPGQEMDSDPAELELRAGARYAVSIHVADRQTLTAWHRVANEVNYVSVAGDHVGDPAPSAFPTRFTAHAWVTGVSVEAPAAAAIAAIGDSITDGLRSTLGARRRWPDALARRLSQAGEGSTAVVNLGISGNRLLSDSPCYGEALDKRFGRDVLAWPGVRAAIVLVGINDIDFAAIPPRRGLDCDEPHRAVTAQDLIDGYGRLIEAAHRRGIHVWVATLTPAGLPPERERLREAVNAWVRSSRVCDGVVDFDATLRDPTSPAHLRALYDSGDGIHPSDAGYAAMAAAVPLDRIIAGAATP